MRTLPRSRCPRPGGVASALQRHPRSQCVSPVAAQNRHVGAVKLHRGRRQRRRPRPAAGAPQHVENARRRWRPREPVALVRRVFGAIVATSQPEHLRGRCGRLDRVAVVELPATGADRVHPELPHRGQPVGAVRGRGRCRVPFRAPTTGRSGRPSSSPSTRAPPRLRHRAQTGEGVPGRPGPELRRAPKPPGPARPRRRPGRPASGHQSRPRSRCCAPQPPRTTVP